MAKKGGKYAAVIGRLPTLSMVAPERREVVEALKTEILEAPTNVDAENLRENITAMLEGIDLRVKKIVELEKRVAAGKPWASEFAKAYAELRAMRDKFAAYDSAIGLLIETYQWLMVEQMEVEGVTSLTLANGQPIHTFKEPYSKVEDPEKYLAWVMADEDLKKRLTLPWMTTNKITKDRLLLGEPEPDGVTCYAKTTVRLGAGDE